MGTSDLEVIRVETVLSRFPMHRLTKMGTVAIELKESIDDGEMSLKWDVSHNSKWGQPGPLAYKVDTLIVNRRIEQTGRPIPRIIRLGSLAEIAEVTGTGAGNTPLIKRALYQNSSAYITAKVTYRGKDGTVRTTEIGDSRYAVVFRGETLPDGHKADAVHIVLHDFYREILDNALTRPLDYDYLRALSPVAQRWYELASFKVFAAVKHGNTARLSYAEFCAHAPQSRCVGLADAKKQMARVHAPHIAAGYITADIEFNPTRGGEGLPDWTMAYVPGPRARSEHRSGDRRALAPSPEPAVDGLVAELVGRGITRAAAVGLVKTFPEAHIRGQIDALLRLQTERPGKVKDAGAYLANAIRSDYAKPAGRVQGRAVEADADKAERARQREEQARIEAYWQGLTPSEKQHLEARALADADDGTRVAAATGMPSMMRLGMKAIREDHIRKLLGVE